MAVVTFRAKLYNKVNNNRIDVLLKVYEINTIGKEYGLRSWRFLDITTTSCWDVRRRLKQSCSDFYLFTYFWIINKGDYVGFFIFNSSKNLLEFQFFGWLRVFEMHKGKRELHSSENGINIQRVLRWRKHKKRRKRYDIPGGFTVWCQKGIFTISEYDLSDGCEGYVSFQTCPIITQHIHTHTHSRAHTHITNV